MKSLWQQITAEGRRLVKVASMAVAGLVLLLIASLFTDDPAKTFFRTLSLLGTGMVLLSVTMMVLTFRKARAVIPGALLVSLATTFAVAGVQFLFAAQRPGLLLAFLALLAGGLVGMGWARTTKVFIDGDAVRSQGTAWYLVVWAITFLSNQLMVLVLGTAPAGGLVILLVGTGVAVGNNVYQLMRYRRATAMLAAPTNPLPQGGV